ncbi:hypothetical protein GKA01_04450 [Gluconobacter kanchanaburiensis NBRC 103587]|uniref:Uncharacterized protein n=1 Tax=Gluconobacter kanchanaburiensis NBRC 103587 TaxID=1307948 RepID=A0A511B482_9PROT|nr:hypothetical protein AA103587_0097 [Gluconobacter kanchanaburiensis NBRC 103587]GEK95248.1 hypothetical protein GKA01_04450 [Gluconobacter kanchanaburiensis NBRC 103587]
MVATDMDLAIAVLGNTGCLKQQTVHTRVVAARIGLDSLPREVVCRGTSGGLERGARAFEMGVDTDIVLTETADFGGRRSMFVIGMTKSGASDGAGAVFDRP